MRAVDRQALAPRVPGRTFCRGVSLGALLVAAFSLATFPAASQTFVTMGPAPSSGPGGTIQSRDIPPDGTVSGAVQSIVVSPTSPGTLYIGTVNGGVWSSPDGGANWVPLSDNQKSLSIATLALDPTDTTSRTLIAGIGVTSNMKIGGEKTGILYSTNAGGSWQAIGVGPAPNLNIVGVAARGDVIVAASADPDNGSAAGGLYLSTNRGASFSTVTLGTGGGTSSVTALAGDPANQRLLYAAQNSTIAANNAVYVSTNSGLSWGATPVLTLPSSQIARLATGPNGAVAVAGFTAGKIASLSLSRDTGRTWISLPVPNINSGGQASTNLAVAIDPGNTGIVYVAGDSNAQATLPAYRITVAADGTATVESLTDGNTANNSTTHADARNFAFDSSGRLLLVGDGGVYVRTSPQTNGGAWSGLNSSSLSLREAYGVAFDSVSKRVMVAAQDTGVALQGGKGTVGYTALRGADGLNAVVNDRTSSTSGYFYYSTQNLEGLTRVEVNRQGAVVRETFFETGKNKPGTMNFEADDYTDTDEEGNANSALPFSSKIVLNRQDPTRIAFGTNYVYTTVDADASSDSLTLTKIGKPSGAVTALAYGARDNADALIAGTAGAIYRYDGTTFNAAPGYTSGTPTALLFDPRAFQRFFVADGSKVRGTTDFGLGFTDFTANFTALNMTRPTSLEFVSKNGVNALFVGGLSTVGNGASPIAVADSDATGTVSGWRAFGNGLPNALVNVLSYNDIVDTLVVSSLGRGVWLLYDLTTYFASANVLNYGLADNDSSPAASFLTNGNFASRDLNKYGTGTLTIAGTTTYSGKTTVISGRLSALGDLTSSSSVDVQASATLSGTGALPTTTVSGTLAPGNPLGTLTVNNGLTFRPGSFYQPTQGGGQTSQAAVVGTATLSGTVQPVFTGGLLNRSSTILTATAGLAGSFQGVGLVNYPGFFSGSLGYGVNSVTLTLASSMASTPGLGGNQAAVGRVLDAAFNSGPGWGAMPALFSLSSGSLMNALSLLAGDNASVGQSMSLSSGAQFAGLLGSHASTLRGPSAPTQAQLGGTAADACDAATACAPAGPLSAWASGFGGAQWLNADPGSGSATSQQTIAGTAFGADYRFDAGGLLGLAAAFSSGGYSIDATNANGRATGVHVGLYGQQSWATAYLNAAIAYGRFDGGATRYISGIGTTETARSTVVSQGLSGRVEIGRPFDIGRLEAGRLGLTPFVAAEPSQVWTPGYSETSTTVNGTAGAFALAYQPQSTGSLPSLLGAQLDLDGTLGGKPFRGWMRASWVHEFLTARSVTAGFAVFPGSTFTVDGAAAASDAGRLAFGASWGLTDTIEAYANGVAEASWRGQSLSGTVGVRITW